MYEPAELSVLFDKINVHFNHPIPSILAEKGVYTIGQMIKLSNWELLRMRNYGIKSIQKVNQFRELYDHAEHLLRTMPKYTWLKKETN